MDDDHSQDSDDDSKHLLLIDNPNAIAYMDAKLLPPTTQLNQPILLHDHTNKPKRELTVPAADNQKRKNPLTLDEVKEERFRKQKEAAQLLKVSTYVVRQGLRNFGVTSNWQGKTLRRILFLYVTTNDNRHDGFHVPEMSKLADVKRKINEYFNLTSESYNLNYFNLVEWIPLDTDYDWEVCINTYRNQHELRINLQVLISKMQDDLAFQPIRTQVPVLGVSSYADYENEVTLRVLKSRNTSEEFWDRLLCRKNSPWFDTTHIDSWVELIHENRQEDARWSILPSFFYFYIVRKKNMRHLGNGTEHRYPAWRNIDWVLFPLCVGDSHWVLAVLNLQTWELNTYDSLQDVTPSGEVISYPGLRGAMNSFMEELPHFLSNIGYFNLDVNVHINYRPLPNVPQQARGTGDCGVFCCYFMEQLTQDLPLDIATPPQEFAYQYRQKMARDLYATRVI